MQDTKTFELNGHYIEFIPESHIYIVDGVIVPCVSNILAYKFNDYVGVSKEVLNRASELGSRMHHSIEVYEKEGIESDLKEFRNYLFLKKYYKFKNIDNEVPVIYERDGQVLYIGTLDQIIEIDDKLGINDFKRVASPNKEKIKYQVNLYKKAYEQTYNKKIDFLAFTQLREDVRKFNELPIDEEKAMSLLEEYLESREA